MNVLHPQALYNEIDEYAAEWLENLIARGLIAPGVVDRRSIIDVRANDLRGFRQVHFFAGIGVWSYSLRRAGVSDDTALWTASPPCQPFSEAGQRGGVDDERHLWPALFDLIREYRPKRFFGEQVASKDGLGWLDLVLTDMEKAQYAIAALDTCSASAGSPHIRQRIRIAAYDLRSAASALARSDNDERWTDLTFRRSEGRTAHGRCGTARELVDSTLGGMADYKSSSVQDESECIEPDLKGRATVILGTDSRTGVRTGGRGDSSRSSPSRSVCRKADEPSRAVPNRPSPTNGFWRDADWLFCRDGKWRPVEPQSFPLVDGSAFRVGSGSTFEGKSRQDMLKGYGNAIDAEATTDFIEACLERETIELESLRTNASQMFEDLI